MKITFVGNFDVPFTTESHHKKTYEKLGHTVFPFREAKATKEEILVSAMDSDMLVWTHTHGWVTEGMGEIFSECRKRNIPTVGYHLDLFKGIKREIDLEHDPYWNIEYFFTVDKNFVTDLEKRGIKAYYLPAGVLEEECYMAEPDRRRFPYDVIFVGSRGYHFEWQYRPQLIDWLKKTYGDKFGHYGGDGLGVVRGHDLNVLYASAKVVVGDTLCMGFDYPYYFSDRLFETTGRGGFLIFPYINGIDEMYIIKDDYMRGQGKFTLKTCGYCHRKDLGQREEHMTANPDCHDMAYPCPTSDAPSQMIKDAGGKYWRNYDFEIELYHFENFHELKTKIDYYLVHDEEREKIRLAGHERTKRDHTYTQRLTELINIIFNKNK